MKLALTLLASTILLSGCATTAQSEESTELTQPTTSGWEQTIRNLYVTSCGIANEDADAVRDWFIKEGETAVAAAVKLHDSMEALPAKVNIKFEEIDKDVNLSDDEKDEQRENIIQAAKEIEKSYRLYHAELNKIFDITKPSMCGEKRCYDVRYAETKDNIKNLHDYLKPGGGEEWLSTVTIFLEIAFPIVKDLFKQSCVYKLRQEMEGERLKIDAIKDVNLVESIDT